MNAPMIGLDLVDTPRLTDRLRRTPALAAELFHVSERAYAETQTRPIENLAARLAAKEAVIKALGIDGFDPLDVEVTGGGERCGIRLHGDAAARAKTLGVQVTVSMSHLRDVSAAVALASPLPGAA